MKYPAAIKLAIQAMQSEKKKYAVDSNLYRLYGVRTPTAENAHKAYCELDEAISVLKDQPALNIG